MAMMFVFCFLMMITIMTRMVVDDKDVERSWIGLRFFRCFLWAGDDVCFLLLQRISFMMMVMMMLLMMLMIMTMMLVDHKDVDDDHTVDDIELDDCQLFNIISSDFLSW